MSRASVSMVRQEEVKVHCYLNHYVMYKTVMDIVLEHLYDYNSEIDVEIDQLRLVCGSGMYM